MTKPDDSAYEARIAVYCRDLKKDTSQPASMLPPEMTDAQLRMKCLKDAADMGWGPPPEFVIIQFIRASKELRQIDIDSIREFQNMTPAERHEFGKTGFTGLKGRIVV